MKYSSVISKPSVCCTTFNCICFACAFTIRLMYVARVFSVLCLITRSCGVAASRNDSPTCFLLLSRALRRQTVRIGALTEGRRCQQDVEATITSEDASKFIQYHYSLVNIMRTEKTGKRVKIKTMN